MNTTTANDAKKSESCQRCPNAIALGEMLGIKVHVVEGAGHMLAKEYVSNLLNQWG